MDQHQQYHQQQPQPPQPSYNEAYQPTKTMSDAPAPPSEIESGKGHAVPHSHGKGKNWAFGLFDCFSPLNTCCLGYWCPCYLFGRTYERNKFGEKEPSGFNGMCLAWIGLACCGFSPCLQCVNRQNQRDKYGIEGNMAGDFCLSCCCGCCTLIQEDKESVVRMNGVDPKTGVAYQAVPQMSYPA